MSPAAPTSPARQVRVTAVVVSHDGSTWIPRLLRSLQSSTRRPDRMVVVDTGSQDGSAQLWEDALGPDAVVHADRRIGFGAAVQHGLDHLDGRGRPGSEGAPDDPAEGVDDWVWLLHDDLALDPAALERLVTAVTDDSGLAVVGPKVREWPARRRLLEAGLTITGTGRRDVGVDPGEFDQGQHDQQRRTLAVGSAGMLVRRAVWDDLGGFDPRFPFFGDDLDFGWRAARAGHRTAVVPAATVYHDAAAARGRRRVDGASGGARALARKHAILTLLAHARAWALPLVGVRLLAGSLLRALGYLLIRSPGAAWAELRAVGGALGRVDRLFRLRRRRTGDGSVAGLRPPWWAPYRQGLDTVGQVLSEAYAAAAERRQSVPRDVETGPVADEAENLAADTGPVGWLTRHPAVALAVVLAVLALLARGVDLFGSGLLRGGALLPAPPEVRDWWTLYLESWHPVGTGSDVPAPPYVLVLAALGTVLLGAEWLVVDLLVGMAVPLCAFSAYVVLRRAVRSFPIRLWAAVSYGLLPVLTGAVAQGRLGTLAATVAAPFAAYALARTVLAPSPERRLRSGILTGLLVAVVGAFAPSALLLSLLVVPGLLAMLVVRRRADARTVAGLVAAALLPFVVLVPWSLHLGLDLVAWLPDAGYAAGVPDAGVASRWAAALGRPGGPGEAPAWLGAGAVVAAVAALFRVDRRGPVLAAWGVGLAALLLVAAQRWYGVWPGLCTVVLHGAAVAAAAVAADGAVARLTGASFGWRQPAAAVATAAAVLGTVLGAGWWLVTEDSLVQRRPPEAIPAFMADAQLEPTGPRTLVATADGGSGVRYHLSRGPGMFLGQEAVAVEDGRLTELVGRLLSDPGPGTADTLAAFGVAYVVLDNVDASTVATVDGTPGLERASAGETDAAAWRVDLPSGGARLVADGALAAAQLLPAAAGRVDSMIDAGPDERQLLLAERSDDRWEARLSGEALALVEAPTEGTAAAGTVTFAVPGDAGRLESSHRSPRRWWLGLQLAVVVLALVLAAPSRRADERAASAPDEDDRGRGRPGGRRAAAAEVRR